MKLFQTRMAEARQPTGAAARRTGARGTTRGDYHANHEIALIVGACVFPWFKSSTKG